jgi:flagellar protein FlgJ
MQRIDGLPLMNSSQQLAFDPQQVVAPNANETQSLQQAAEQFETLFLQLVLKNMRTASDAVSGDEGMFSSNEQQLFRDMYDGQLAQQMAGQGQVGLAGQIIRQFATTTDPEVPAAGSQLQNNSAALFKFSAEAVAVTLYPSEPAVVVPQLSAAPPLSGETYQDFGSRALSQPLLMPQRQSEKSS